MTDYTSLIQRLRQLRLCAENAIDGEAFEEAAEALATLIEERKEIYERAAKVCEEREEYWRNKFDELSDLLSCEASNCAIAIRAIAEERK